MCFLPSYAPHPTSIPKEYAIFKKSRGQPNGSIIPKTGGHSVYFLFFPWVTLFNTLAFSNRTNNGMRSWLASWANLRSQSSPVRAPVKGMTYWQWWMSCPILWLQRTGSLDGKNVPWETEIPSEMRFLIGGTKCSVLLISLWMSRIGQKEALLHFGCGAQVRWWVVWTWQSSHIHVCASNKDEETQMLSNVLVIQYSFYLFCQSSICLIQDHNNTKNTTDHHL